MKTWQTVVTGCLLFANLTVSLPEGRAQSEPNKLLERINQMARDMYMTEKTVGGKDRTGEERAAAIAKETSTMDDLKRTIASVNEDKDAAKAVETLRSFSYRVSTPAEKKAFQQTLMLLESRLKFLAQTEKADLASHLGTLNLMGEEVGKMSVSSDRASRPRVNSIAAAGRSTTSRSLGSELLGAEVKNGKTAFSVYAPDSTEVCLVLFEKEADKAGKGYAMKKGNDGVWRATIDSELYGKYYGFSVDGPKEAGFLFDPKRLLSDPYARANVDHDGKSIVVRTDFTWSDGRFKTPAPQDLIVYEMHVKDYTAHASSGVPAAKRGTYLGLLEGKGTPKVLGNLIDLGVTAVELMPVHEFDNNFAAHPNHWGYMTSHFFAPECSFASGKKGEAVREFKQVVNGFRQNGIAVIMDVVFNHTSEGNEQGLPLNFKGLDNPGYYRLTADKKFYWNGTGCGNEFRSDSPMGRKLIMDSLKYFSKEYHVDGFRFDLGTILDKDTMGSILRDLPPSMIIVAEPWAADWQRNQWGKSDFRNTKLGKWNDDYREKIRAFCKGEGERNDVMTVIAGTCFWWTAKPTESVNFIACHDGYTANDFFHGNKAQAKLSTAILLTSQGIPMMHQGDEFLKSKNGNHNSYDQDNEINWIDWGAKTKNKDVFDFTKGLVALRKKYANFRHAVAMNNQHLQWLQPANHRGLGYLLKGTPNLLVLLNSDKSNWISFGLPEAGNWTVVCNGDKVDDSGKLGTASGDYNVPPMTAIILRK
jgi:pullulanase/glycogen debranching enzyme